MYAYEVQVNEVFITQNSQLNMLPTIYFEKKWNWTRSGATHFSEPCYGRITADKAYPS